MKILFKTLSYVFLLIGGFYAGARQPNVLFILADDLGWMDTAFQGSEYFETPNLDQLAKRGMVFQRAYSASPLCSPTRASILTGQYPGRLRYTRPAGHYPKEVLNPVVPDSAAPEYKATNPGTRTRLPMDYWTLADELKSHGYATTFMGKWHLGREPYVPEEYGFDVVIGGREHPGPPGSSYFGPWDVDSLPVVPEGTHIADVLAKEASGFIEENRDNPFFLCLWFYDVHAPFQAKGELVKKYATKSPDGDQRSPEMGAMIETMDAAIGRVLATIDRLKLNDETIIIFTSDNGGNMFDVVDGVYPTSNQPLRGGKGTNYEGGVRVPLIVAWPGHIKAGTTSKHIVTSPDFFPTILDLTHLQKKPNIHVDGESFVNASNGGPTQRTDPIFSHFPHPYIRQNSRASISMTDERWKLYRFFNDAADRSHRYELYDLQSDPGESKNLAATSPDLVASMDAQIQKHLEDTGSLVPKLNANYAGNTVGVWNGNDEAILSSDHSVLRVKAIGDDPQVRTKFVPGIANQSALITFEIKADHPNTGSFYWSDGKHKKFNRQQRVQFAFDGASEWKRCEIEFDIEGKLNGLRIDPINTKGEASIRSIKLLSSKGVLLREWDF